MNPPTGIGDLAVRHDQPIQGAGQGDIQQAGFIDGIISCSGESVQAGSQHRRDLSVS